MVVTTMHYELCTMNYPLPHNSPLSHIPTFLHFHIITFSLLHIYYNINMCLVLPFITQVHIYMVIKIVFWVHVFTYKIKENNMFRQENKEID